MGIFRLFKGELKKIFLKPGIFIMSGLLILVLAIAPKFFSPTLKTDTSSIKIYGTTVSERFLNFREKFLEEQDGDFVYPSVEAKAKDIDELIRITTSPLDELQNSISETATARQAFSGLIQVDGVSEEDLPELKSSIETLHTKLTNTKSIFLEYTVRDIPLLLVTKNQEANITFALTNFIAKLEDQYIGQDKTIADYKDLDEYIKTNNFINILTKNIQKLKNLKYDKAEMQLLYNDYYANSTAKLTTLYNQMAIMATSSTGGSSDAKDIVKIDKLIYRYLGTANNVDNILKYGVMNLLAQKSTDKELSSYEGEIFKDFNSYKAEEAYTKYTYLYKNNKSDGDYANVLAFNHSSNKKANAYDYMYFVMEIMSFVIIAYCVILGANMIAGEQSSGTMKMLAIRPYKRWKIMFAKILTTLFFAFTFMLITTIVSLITGVIIYDLNSLPMLAVFNAKYVFTISAPLMYMLYFASVFIKIWIFVMIAFAISTIFKNGIISTTISTFLYLITMIITFVSSGANWVKFIPTANLDIYKYFGGAFIVQPGGTNPLTNLFISPVFTDTNIIFSSIIIGVLFIGLHLLTYLFFTKRDIN